MLGHQSHYVKNPAIKLSSIIVLKILLILIKKLKLIRKFIFCTLYFDRCKTSLYRHLYGSYCPELNEASAAVSKIYSSYRREIRAIGDYSAEPTVLNACPCMGAFICSRSAVPVGNCYRKIGIFLLKVQPRRF